jgi:hypothetical protein
MSTRGLFIIGLIVVLAALIFINETFAYSLRPKIMGI